MSIREELRQEIEETKIAFHELLAIVPDEALPMPSDNPAWNVGEVLYHMSIAPRMLGKDVSMILKHEWVYRVMPSIVPKALFDWTNKNLTKFNARHMSREFLAKEYDEAHESTIAALDSVQDSDFSKHVEYPDWDPMLSGDVTLERLFHYIKAHFDDHAGQIRDIVTKI